MLTRIEKYAPSMRSITNAKMLAVDVLCQDFKFVTMLIRKCNTFN